MGQRANVVKRWQARRAVRKGSPVPRENAKTKRVPRKTNVCSNKLQNAKASINGNVRNVKRRQCSNARAWHAMRSSVCVRVCAQRVRKTETQNGGNVNAQGACSAGTGSRHSKTQGKVARHGNVRNAARGSKAGNVKR